MAFVTCFFSNLGKVTHVGPNVWATLETPRNDLADHDSSSLFKDCITSDGSQLFQEPRILLGAGFVILATGVVVLSLSFSSPIFLCMFRPFSAPLLQFGLAFLLLLGEFTLWFLHRCRFAVWFCLFIPIAGFKGPGNENSLSSIAVLSIVVRLVVFHSLLMSHVSSVLLVSQCAGMANRALPKRFNKFRKLNKFYALTLNRLRASSWGFIDSLRNTYCARCAL
ncbi:hypothetical protein N9K81_03220 [Candidatus Poseidoniales archaeon]|nr:hypothetical protein [Candidatus Poseidoniales archaeon]